MKATSSFNPYRDGNGIVEPRFLHSETIPMRRRENDWTIRLHRHPELFRFLLLTAGAANMQRGGSTAHLGAPARTAVKPNASHGYVFRPDTEGYVLTVAEAPRTVSGIRRTCERVFLESRKEQAGKYALVAADMLRILALFIRLAEGAGLAPTQLKKRHITISRTSRDHGCLSGVSRPGALPPELPAARQRHLSAR
jgi:AraC family transcriptional activator of pobA